MKRREKIHVKEIFLNQPCRKCINSSFLSIPKKKRRKIVQKVTYLFRYNQITKKILHLIEASFKNYKKGNSTDH